jgi:predicted dehydrogenase
LLHVGHIERYNPALWALEAFEQPFKYIAAERLSTHTFRSTDIGAVFDIMIHDLDVLLSLEATPIRSVDALGVCLFGGHEDIAQARITFEDGCIADLTASRASFQTVRRMRLWSVEGYATLDFAAQQATVIRPSDQLRRGQLDLDGVDLSQPAAVKQHLFGKVLRVDQCHPARRDQLTLELEDFVTAVRTGTSPRVPGSDGLRAIRLAEQILDSLERHAWDGQTGARSFSHLRPDASEGLTGPKAWKYRASARPSSVPWAES